jgi:G6PDH family F420-dependent oxidoreductase
MAKFGYFLSSEEFGPRELVAQAKRAEQAGFECLWISDHFHPWVEKQGESGFVWSMIGAIAEATDSIPLTTAVTCPMLRIHPAIIAQATATSALLMGPGRFNFGVGTGEALNEHIFGDAWPAIDMRLEMLDESLEVIRKLWTGKQVTHRGKHYTVETARLYSIPDTPPPIYISGFGPKAIRYAGEHGDGYCNVVPDKEQVDLFRSSGGGDKVVQGGTKVCWGEDEAAARRTAWETWPNEGLEGELPQLLPTPAHFEQATQLVTEEMVAESVACGPDLDKHVAQLQAYVDAGYDEIFVQQIGPDQEGFFKVYESEVLPRLRR